MKVLNFSSLNYDYVYNVDHIMMPGETQASTGLNTFCGVKTRCYGIDSDSGRSGKLLMIGRRMS